MEVCALFLVELAVCPVSFFSCACRGRGKGNASTMMMAAKKSTMLDDNA